MNAPFVLAAGGTGGHLFPAQALAGELMRRGGRVVVMTDGRGHNYGNDFPGAEIATVPAATFVGRSFLGRFAALGVITVGVVTALMKLVNLRPRAVVGFGGYPSLPVMMAASLARVPSALHEQNAVLGRVNRLLAPRVAKIAATFPFARFAPKDSARVVFTGNPVRPEAAALRKGNYSPPTDGGPIRLLIFGGSQGARVLSELVPQALAGLPQDMRARLDITQQVRADDLDMVESAYRASGLKAQVAKFFTDLPRRMGEAHLIIARSGASTLSELTVIGRPAILIPYPFAMDDHQAANAAVLDKAGAAWVVRQDALDAAGLSQLLTEILTHPQSLSDRAAAAKALGHPDAAERLADLAEHLAEGQTPLSAMLHQTDAMRVPLSIGAIHFIGIGGIGMSGIAEVMRNLGYRVQGSDSSDSANVKRLRELGIPVAIGQRAENLGEAQVVVYSSAVKPDNPEFAAARATGLPIVRRAEMLAELMRLKRCVAIAGTHGKTTTTTMVAALLDGGGLDPTVVNGGIINAYGTNARLGAGDWMVVEADESDGTFLRLPATAAIVTNVDPEHLDHYGDFDKVRMAFQIFVENLPFYGFAVMCADHPEVLAMIARIRDRRIVSYGFSPQADARAVNVSFSQGASHFDAVFRDRRKGTEIALTDLRLPMPGEHNVSNAIAAITVARELGVGTEAIRSALNNFGGVKRRFTRVGEWKGTAIIDDYGHHPVEIAAVLKAARQAFSGPIIAVMQPHRYTRLRDLFEQFCTCMNSADTAIIAPVYPAGEAPIEGINRDSLIEGMQRHGHKHVLAIDGAEDLVSLVASLARPGGAVVCLGAGSITGWAAGLESALTSREAKR